MGLIDRVAGAVVQRVDTAVATRVDAAMDAAQGMATAAHGVAQDLELNKLQLYDQVLQRVDSIKNAITGLGTTYDKGQSARPNTSRAALTESEIDVLWRFCGYARRLIQMVPKHATRKGWKVVVTEEVEGSSEVEESEPLKDDMKALGVFKHFKKAHTMARKDGGALIWMVVDEEGDPPLKEPLDFKKVTRLCNLIVLTKEEASVNTYEANVRNRRFRTAATYNVTPMNTSISEVVHASRMLYFGGAETDVKTYMGNGGWDDSMLQAWWDNIRDTISVDQAGAILAQDLRSDVLKIEGLEDLEVSDQRELFEMRIQEMAKSKSLLGINIIGGGEDFQSIPANTTGYKELRGGALEGMAMSADVPLVRLTGNSPGGLSTDDQAGRSAWTEGISEEQGDNYDEPMEILGTVMFCAKEGPTNGLVPESWEVIYNPLDQPSEKELAEIRNLHAEFVAKLVMAGVLNAQHVAESMFTAAGYSSEIKPVVTVGDLDEEALQAARAALKAEQAAEADDDDTNEPEPLEE